MTQNGWGTVQYLLPRFLGTMVLAALLFRPLDLLTLGDEGARGLGLRASLIQILGMLLAVALAAFVVSAVGVIGFIGLAAPAIVRGAGARTLKQRMILAPVLGATLLWCADQAVQLASSPVREWPTGTATALLGAPLLLLLLPRLSPAAAMPSQPQSSSATRVRRPWLAIAAGAIVLVIGSYLAATIGRGFDGWNWLVASSTDPLITLRLPRIGAAIAAGALLAVAGNLIQRLTGNPMASPEVLGIGVGASLGVIAAALAVQSVDRSIQLGAATLGALGALVLIIGAGRRSSFQPEKMLLTGVALATVFGALMTALMAAGDPRMGMLLSWLAGSTYQVTASDTILVLAVALVLLPTMPLFVRWLDILPLGETSSRALGVSISTSRFRLLLVTAVMTGAATLIVGPLSFVGLMAPHMARMMGLHRPMALVQVYLEGRPVIVLDEWAAEQDPTFRRLFYAEILPDLKAQGRTLIVISHDDRYFGAADRIARIEKGKIVEEIIKPAPDVLAVAAASDAKAASSSAAPRSLEGRHR